MPQTRFVLGKALEVGLRPIVVVNKIDRPDARTLEVVDEAHELIVELGGEEFLDDFECLFASAKEGFAKRDLEQSSDTMRPLLECVLEKVPPPKIDADPYFRMQVTTIDWSEYVGRIAIGRIRSGKITKNQNVCLMQDGDRRVDAKIAGGAFV